MVNYILCYDYHQSVFTIPYCSPSKIVAIVLIHLFCYLCVIFKGSDYFTENFQVKENKTRIRNIHSRFFHLLFLGLRLGFRLGFGLGFDLGIVLE